MNGETFWLWLFLEEFLNIDRVQQRDFIFSYLNQNQNTLSIPKEIVYDFDFIIWCLAMIFFVCVYMPLLLCCSTYK